MGLRGFLRRRGERLVNAALNLAPGPVARTVDQARARRRHQELADRVDALVADLNAERVAAKDERERLEIEELFRRLDELHARTRPLTPGEQMHDDEARRRRDRSARIASGEDRDY